MTSENSKDWGKTQVLCPFGSAPWGAMSNPQPAETADSGQMDFPF